MVSSYLLVLFLHLKNVLANSHCSLPLPAEYLLLSTSSFQKLLFTPGKLCQYKQNIDLQDLSLVIIVIIVVTGGT